MTEFYFTKDTAIDDSALNVIAHLPTESLPKLVAPEFFLKLTDENFMNIATMLAQKSYDEKGCPIGGVIIDSKTRRIIGKGHNTLGQENNTIVHGETAAIIDAGRVAMLEARRQGKTVEAVDFRDTTLFTTLTPCKVCCTQILERERFEKVVIGDAKNASPTDYILLEGGIKDVVIQPYKKAIDLYEKYARENPRAHFIDWGGYTKLQEAEDAGLVPKFASREGLGRNRQ